MEPFVIEHGVDAKIVVMGSAGVGKSSLLHRYVQNRFDPKNTTSTSGALFITKKVMRRGVKVRLQLWDTAGQERFRSMVGAVFHDVCPGSSRVAGAHVLSRCQSQSATALSLLTFSRRKCCSAFYDITNASSFDDVRSWLLGPCIPLRPSVLTSPRTQEKL